MTIARALGKAHYFVRIGVFIGLISVWLVICLPLRSELIRAAVPLANRFRFHRPPVSCLCSWQARLEAQATPRCKWAPSFSPKPRGEVSGNVNKQRTSTLLRTGKQKLSSLSNKKGSRLCDFSRRRTNEYSRRGREAIFDT